jgi:hypothetical protein
MEQRIKAILLRMHGLLEESRRLREQHEGLMVEYDQLKRELDSGLGKKQPQTATVAIHSPEGIRELINKK